MKVRRRRELALLLLGAGPRLAGAVLLATSLWVGFLWAVASPGGS